MSLVNRGVMARVPWANAGAAASASAPAKNAGMEVRWVIRTLLGRNGGCGAGQAESAEPALGDRISRVQRSTAACFLTEGSTGRAPDPPRALLSLDEIGGN